MRSACGNPTRAAGAILLVVPCGLQLQTGLREEPLTRPECGVHRHGLGGEMRLERLGQHLIGRDFGMCGKLHGFLCSPLWSEEAVVVIEAAFYASRGPWAVRSTPGPPLGCARRLRRQCQFGAGDSRCNDHTMLQMGDACPPSCTGFPCTAPLPPNTQGSAVVYAADAATRDVSMHRERVSPER